MTTPTLVATAGAVNANTYVTLAEADLYHEARLFNTDWTSALDDAKNKALLWATRSLDRLPFLGLKSNDVDVQALRWPRVSVLDIDGYSISSTIIPPQVKNATCELAMLLLGADRAADTGTEGFDQLTVGPITLKIQSNDRADAISKEVMLLLVGLFYRGIQVGRG